MTIQDLISLSETNSSFILWYFGATFGLTLLTLLFVSHENFNSSKYMLSILVYAVSIPGILALILILYSAIFIGTNLLQINVISYYLPLTAMTLTLTLINRKIAMSRIPGFSKISAFLFLITISFSLLFILSRTYFGIHFLGNFTSLLVVFILLLILVKFLWNKFIK